MEKKERIFRNSARDLSKDKIAPYTPQYQIRGIQPMPFGSAGVNIQSKNVENKLPLDNPRATRSFSPPAIIPSEFLNALPPNVNLDKPTWSTVDTHIVYDLEDEVPEVDAQKVVDTNDYYSAQSFGFDSEEELERAMEKAQRIINKENQQVIEEAPVEERVPATFQNLQDDEFALIINNDIISKGTIEEIQYQVNLILFGDILDSPIDKDTITIVKKVKLRVGAFIDW